MISISVVGRLAAQPELKILPGGLQVCEFRLLDSRFSKGQEVTEAVTFFCFGEVAEEFCSTAIKGQEISATGTQETQTYTPADGKPRSYVKYRLSWFSRGRKPYTGERNQGQNYSGTRQSGPEQQENQLSQRPARFQPEREKQFGHAQPVRPQKNNAPDTHMDNDFAHSGFGSSSDEPGFLP
jgi:single-stranded DNA-binding protein